MAQNKETPVFYLEFHSACIVLLLLSTSIESKSFKEVCSVEYFILCWTDDPVTLLQKQKQKQKMVSFER